MAGRARPPGKGVPPSATADPTPVDPYAFEAEDEGVAVGTAAPAQEVAVRFLF